MKSIDESKHLDADYHLDDPGIRKIGTHLGGWPKELLEILLITNSASKTNVNKPNKGWFSWF